MDRVQAHNTATDQGSSTGNMFDIPITCELCFNTGADISTHVCPVLKASGLSDMAFLKKNITGPKHFKRKVLDSADVNFTTYSRNNVLNMMTHTIVPVALSPNAPAPSISSVSVTPPTPTRSITDTGPTNSSISAPPISSPNPSNVTTVDVLRTLRGRVLAFLGQAKLDGQLVDMNEVAFVNRYIAALFCLGQGKRPTDVESMLLLEYASALDSQPHIQNNREYRLIKVGRTSATLMLYPEDCDLFADYNRYARQPILLRTGKSTPQFLVQWNGNPFRTVTAGISRLQEQAGLLAYTYSQAIQSLQTHSQGISVQTQADVKMFLSPPQHQRVRCSVSDYSHINAGIAIQNIIALYVDRQQNPLAVDTNLHKPSPVSGTLQLDEPDMLASKVSPTVECAIREIFNEYKPITSLTVFPTSGQLKSRFNLTAREARIVSERLKYKRIRAIHVDVATKVLQVESKRQRVSVSTMASPAELPASATLKRYAGGVSIQIKTLARLTKEQLTGMQHINPQLSLSADDDAIAARIKAQDWPNLTIRDTKLRGRGVFSGMQWTEKDTILCDYHGTLLTGKEGESVQSQFTGEDGNYLLFFQDPRTSRRLCIDGASIPCQCHPDMETTLGRIFNHSGKSANVTKVARRINDKPCVLLVAMIRIAPDTELLFDYGVRTGLDGEVIDFLQE